MTAPTILFDSLAEGEFGLSWRFEGFIAVIEATLPEHLPKVLAEAEAAAGNGYYAAGFVTYEAANGLNHHLPPSKCHPGLPLAWFAIFRERRQVKAGEGLPPNTACPVSLHPEMDQESHSTTVSKIKDAIAAGESYQINYTFRLSGTFDGNPKTLYHNLLISQRPSFGAFIDTGRHTIVSASPELFFSIKAGIISTRPMKGTASRGRYPDEDAALAEELLKSPKERAENLMIVDLLRNDLSQVSKTGSVKAGPLFISEQYPTVHQITSRISARMLDGISLPRLFGSLFPCGSVTGTPKKRSMEIIGSLETAPRGIYCGAIGCISPDGEMTFSVAIRTALLENNDISVGVGSGITWDSDPSAEYSECLTKAAFMDTGWRPRLLESMLLEDGRFPLVSRHLERIRWSASRLGYSFDLSWAEAELYRHAGQHGGTRKARMLLDPDGSISIDSEPLNINHEPLRLSLSSCRVNPQDLSLYLKTDHRKRYEDARLQFPDADEVILCNHNDELTEGSYNNLVLKLDGRLLTPPVSCGLLPGIMRQEALDSGKISELRLTLKDLARAEEIWLLNAVRGWRKGVMA